ncbi:hypothetical protein M3Y98_00325700 [Aphelenchoides besseyi]|nr:hypothetical protein M3Y98_00325700 [Aphelenchoides besseyi]KAI6201454.1 hypothetical protein M3Y96_00843500 [Aphelenchoides besseyi]
MPRSSRKSVKHAHELVLLEVLENAQQLLQLDDPPPKRRVPRLCLAPASAVLLAQSTGKQIGLASDELDPPRTPISHTEAVEMTMIELSEMEIQQLKEQNHRRIKRVVTVVAITLMLISFILVALSLSLGPKIDQLVSESLDTSLSSKDLFLGPKRNDTQTK